MKRHQDGSATYAKKELAELVETRDQERAKLRADWLNAHGLTRLMQYRSELRSVLHKCQALETELRAAGYGPAVELTESDHPGFAFKIRVGRKVAPIAAVRIHQRKISC